MKIKYLSITDGSTYPFDNNAPGYQYPKAKTPECIFSKVNNPEPN